MHRQLPPLRLTGGTLLRGDQLRRGTLAIEEGRIAEGRFPAVDIAGHWVLPGAVDLCGAPMAAPARADARAAAAGVTTACLVAGWSWEGGARTPARAEAALAALRAYRPGATIDLRALILCDTHAPATDRLPGALQGQEAATVLFADALAARPGPCGLRAAAARRAAAGVPRRLCTLACHFDALGIRYGSFADRDGETREAMSMLGARLCVAPASWRAAAAAHAVGDPVLLPASSVLSGGGPLCATTLIRAGRCAALVSGGDPEGLLRAVFRLCDRRILSLPAALSFVTSRPAAIAGMADRGVLRPGRRADITLVCKATRRVAATIAAGRLVHATPALARRFPGAEAAAVAAE